MNVLYTGLSNPISIAIENVSCKSIVVKTTIGKISGENCNYTFHSEQIGKVEIILYRKINRKLKEIGRSAFRVKSLPPLY
jgi:hypothetical protein